MVGVYVGPPVWAVFVVTMACLTLMTMGILWATDRYDNKDDDYQRNRIIGAVGVLMCIIILSATVVGLFIGWE
jgi:xanthine/uracil permease